MAGSGDLAGLGARGTGRRGVDVADHRLRPVCLSSGHAFPDRPRSRNRDNAPRARGHSENRRSDPAGHGRRLPCLRVLRTAVRIGRSRDLCSPRVWPRPTGRHAVHDPRRHLRGSAGCSGHLHRVVHDLRGRVGPLGRWAFLHQLDDVGVLVGPAAAQAPDEP